MKRLLSLILVCCIFVSTVGCGEKGTVSGDEQVKAYEKVERRETRDLKEVAFTFANSRNNLSLNVPSSWEFSRQDKGYRILRGRDEIGYVTSVAPADEVTKEKEELGRDTAKMQVSQILYQKDDTYYSRFIYADKDSSAAVYLDVLYAELGDFVLNNLLKYPAMQGRRTVPIKIRNGGKKILILGNQLLVGSEIETFLQQMLTKGGTGFEAEVVCQYDATIKTFADDKEYMDMLSKGHYAAVFQCGLYAPEQTNRITKLNNACTRSKTAFVIFPAFNESVMAVSKCQTEYTDISLLNWQGELQAFIDGGVEESVLHRGGSDGYTTPIGGYVGAHMIYRSMFGSMPPKIENDHMLGVRSKLGNYEDTGMVSPSNGSKTYQLP